MRLFDYRASGNCYKVRLALAQLAVPYERVPVDIFAGETLTDEFARLNPVRTTPVLVPDDGPPLPESGAILIHLAEGTPLLPDDPADRAQVYRWLFFEQSALMPTIAGLRFRFDHRAAHSGLVGGPRPPPHGGAAARVVGGPPRGARVPRRDGLLGGGHRRLRLRACSAVTPASLSRTPCRRGSGAWRLSRAS